MSAASTSPIQCPVTVRRFGEIAYLEVRTHEGGLSLIRADKINYVLDNCYGRAVIWGPDNLCCATLHEYDEVFLAIKEAHGKGMKP